MAKKPFTMEKESKDLLQTCVPGVTVSTTHDSCTDSPRLFHYYHSYQTLYVEDDEYNDDADDDEGSPMYHSSPITQHVPRLEEQRQRNRIILLIRLSLLLSAVWFYCYNSSTTTNSNESQSNHSSLPTWTVENETATNATRVGDDRQDHILTALKNLDEDIQGDIVLASTKQKFQMAAKVWSLGREPPLAVVEAFSIQDVALAVPILAGLSKEYSLEFRVKSGGHSFDGASTVQGGVMLSLAKLNAMTLSWDPENDDDDDANQTQRMKMTTTPQHRKQQQQDPSPKTVIVQSGVKMEDFLGTVLDQHGYESVVSSAAGVAFGGFLLGGGYGSTSRLHGLAMDQVIRIKAVLVNGTVVDVYAPNATTTRTSFSSRSSQDNDNDDLFWGLLGAGGGNFAVAVEYELKVYPSKDMKLGAKVKMPISYLTQFLQKVGEKEPKLDDRFIASVEEFELSGGGSSPDGGEDDTRSFQSKLLKLKSEAKNGYRFSRLGKTNNNDDQYNDTEEEGTATVTLHWMGDSNGGSDDGEVGMDYINQNVVSLIPQKVRKDVTVSYYYFSWSGITRQKEQSETWRTVWAAQAWNGFLMPENNTAAVWQSIYKDMMTMFQYCTFLVPNIELWGGAISQRTNNETAFAHRQAVYNVGVRLMVPNGTKEEQHFSEDQSALVSAVWPSIAKHLQGVYVNYPMSSLAKEDYPNAYWGDNLDRLVKLKDQFDPDNYLHHPHSVPSAKK
ncbi:unnamed protein product [Cylindrotheca closterium]|uniref:FAD-binding PCMH-type domain-containing protein n=1 Tax=Cylindrotheca closterium TaxID=2856 RepID=A0AAD2FUK9_9STRA|nr:unnamed protein product [Cylindrotheca closterium]